jgi:hypothetical protein
LDPRTDLWGVGMTVWCAYTGTSPSKQPSLLRTNMDEHEHGLPYPSELRPGCSRDFEKVVMGLLSIDQAKRPGGAAEALNIIQSIHEGSSVDSESFAKGRRNTDPVVAQGLLAGLLDPLWAATALTERLDRQIVCFENGEYLCREGEKSHQTFVLLKGRVVVERAGTEIITETREGTFLGEVTTLAGYRRTASLRADGPVWACVFNAAELERFIGRNPAIAVRLVKSLAERVCRESGYSADLD